MQKIRHKQAIKHIEIKYQMMETKQQIFTEMTEVTK